MASAMMSLVPLLLVLYSTIFTSQSVTIQHHENVRIPEFNSKGKLEWVPYQERPPAINASANDVRFFYFSSNYINGVEIPHDQVNQLQNTDFSSSRPTYFVIHGWMGQENTSYYLNIDKDLIKAHNPNVIVVDWSKISKMDYITAFANVISIGQLTGAFIENMKSCCSLSYNDLVIVGHSLGAHIAGTTGAALNGQASVIVGLDPAGPMFNYLITENRLTKNDAKYVHVIHTNAGELGFFGDLGHSDFWPNGGIAQPLCIDATGFCSHMRATDYYGESVGTNKFVSHACTDYITYLTGICNGNKEAMMGGYTIDSSVTGTYFLSTHALPPYGRG